MPTSTTTTTTAATTTATTTPAPPPPAPVTYYQNPVYSAAFPDPFVLDNDNTHSDYWAFSTGDLFPALHSADLVHWTTEPTAMKSRPSWVLNEQLESVGSERHPAHPAVSGFRGCYVMYYVGASAAFGQR